MESHCSSCASRSPQRLVIDIKVQLAENLDAVRVQELVALAITQADARLMNRIKPSDGRHVWL